MCSEKDPLTSIEINWNTSTATVILKDINNAWYSKFVEEKCCYSEILRAGAGENADNHFESVICFALNRETILHFSFHSLYF